MIKSLRKKGFTIVELVIVIAVIAILAAILIPTFSGIIKKANIASDTAMAKNMNTALAMADSEGNVPEDMGDVLFILYGAGYVLENLNPTTNGYYFVWDETTNQILFLTDTFEVHYSSEAYSEDTLNWWLPIDEASDVTEIEAIGAKVSYCMAADIAGSFTFDYLANFDTNGFILTGDISYGTSDAAVNDLGSFSVSGIIKGTLLVNAPNANVSHYGAVENVNIVEVSQTSYHEYGFVKNILNLQAGRVVIENTGNVTYLNLSGNSGETPTENKGFINTLQLEGVTALDLNRITNAGIVLEPGGSTPGFTVLIENLNQFESFRDAVNFGMTCEGLTVKLMSDIDISNRYWVPIGYNNKILQIRNGEEPANVFMGIFDGNDKTIKGLTNQGYLAPTPTFWTNAGNITGYLYGLFSVTYDAEIKNLNMTDVNIVFDPEYDSACVGGIVGAVRGNFKMDNCSVKGNIEGTDGIGGAVGYVYLVDSNHPDKDRGKTVEFNDVSVEADIYASIRRAGGIIGANLVYNVFNLVGQNGDNLYNQFIMTGCSFKGTVKAKVDRAGGLFSNSSAGRGGWVDSPIDLPEANPDGLVIQNNSVEGDITSPKSAARFFSNLGVVTNVVSYGNVSSTVFNNTFTGHVYAGSPLLDVTASFGANDN